MGLISALKTLVKGKSDQAAEAIEDTNRVMFAQQSLKEIEDQLRKAQTNLGSMRASMLGTERESKEKTEELASWTAKAKALKEQGKMDLAVQVAEKCMQIQSEVETLKTQYATYERNAKQQEENVTKLRLSLDKGKRQVQQMKSMEQVTKSTEALLEVNTSGVATAISKFDEQVKKSQAKLDQANAMMESQTAGNLDAKVEDALGGDTKASDFLNTL